MAPRNLLSVLLLVGMGVQAACTDSLVPGATEPLALTVQTRPPVAGERLPVLEVTGHAGTVRVQVARPDLACTLAEASVGRVAGTLTVVARVSGDPAALCAGGFVVEYAGLIEDLASGQYRVRIYEAVGSGRPRLLGTRTVTVLAPDA